MSVCPCNTENKLVLIEEEKRKKGEQEKKEESMPNRMKQLEQ